jgi:hypothetical protein
MIIDITRELETRRLLAIFRNGIEDDDGICMTGLNVGVSKSETCYTTPHMINIKKIEKPKGTLLQVTDYFETPIGAYLAENPDEPVAYEDLDTLKDGIARNCTSYTYPMEEVFFEINHNNAKEICVNIAGKYISWFYGDYSIDATDKNAATNVLGVTLHDKTPMEGYSVFVTASYCMEDELKRDADDLYQRIKNGKEQRGGYIRQIGKAGKAIIDHPDFGWHN